MSATALYLAHLNPVTKAHVEIITELESEADRIKVMPVVFRDETREINSRSFPFSFEQRREMINAVFGDRVEVTDDYTFLAPFRRYLPPLLSPGSWKLRRQILRGVEGDYFTYTGDKAEGYMLKLYMLKPRVGTRRPLSATSAKQRLYQAAAGMDSDWQDDVPQGVAEIIEKDWKTVTKFASIEDRTVRVAGMKFPRDGYWHK